MKLQIFLKETCYKTIPNIQAKISKARLRKLGSVATLNILSIVRQIIHRFVAESLL